MIALEDLSHKRYRPPESGNSLSFFSHFREFLSPTRPLHLFGPYNTVVLIVYLNMSLSRTDQRTAKRNSHRIITDNANQVLSDRSPSLSGRETAVAALLAIGRNSDLAREVGSRPPGHLSCLLRNEGLPGGEYRIFADTIAHAAGESNPIEHPNRLLRNALAIRYHLFAATGATQWTSLRPKLDTRGIRTPPCLAGFAFSDICAMGWQIPEPDQFTWPGKVSRIAATT